MVFFFLVDDFLLEYCLNLKPKDFKVKAEKVARNKQGKREYLDDNLTKKLMKRLELHFQTTVNISRIKHGKNQTFETLINEESLLFAKLLRMERKNWTPRLSTICC